MSFKDLTIKDFDFGIGDPIESCVRVSSLSNENVSDQEVNLILWLLLEQEFGFGESRKKKQKPSPEKEDAGTGQETLSDDVDEADCSTVVRKTHVDGVGSNFSARDREHKSQARKYTEELLRAVGVNVPFSRLTEAEKQSLFTQFCASSELLLTEKYSSILELYEALRRRSKFKEQYEILCTLGEGKFGKVLKVKRKSASVNNSCGCSTQALNNENTTSITSSSSSQLNYNDVFAIKLIPLSIDSLQDVRMILNESAILKTLNVHPNIVRFYDSWLGLATQEENENAQHMIPRVDEDTLLFYLQMELCGLSLFQWKEKLKKIFDEKTCIRVGKQLASSFEWIHNHNILHLDLNPKNIFWRDDSFQDIKIGDFGLAARGELLPGRRGTTPYCAPEANMTQKSDMYSIGVTLLEMSQVFKTRSEFNRRLEDKKDFETEFKFMDEILPHLLTSDPSARWDASKLYSAFAGYDPT